MIVDNIFLSITFPTLCGANDLEYDKRKRNGTSSNLAGRNTKKERGVMVNHVILHWYRVGYRYLGYRGISGDIPREPEIETD